MAITLTDQAYSALQQAAKEPNLVVKIDGIDRIFGGSIIKKYVRFGDGSEIGDPAVSQECFYIGGLNSVQDQDNLITLDGTSTSIKQTLDPAKGQGASISTLSIALIDTGYMSELVSPGAVVDDILQRKCKVFFGFNGTAWPDDYSVAFRGFITDVTTDAGKVVLTLNHADDKKRTNIFKSIKTSLKVGIDASGISSILPQSVEGFLMRVSGPYGVDTSFTAYVKIDDEIIRYDSYQEGVTGPLPTPPANPTGISSANPCVVTSFSHRLPEGTPVVFTTTGLLPSPIISGATYYVRSPSTNAFNLSSVPGGGLINTVGASQFGAHSITTPSLLSGIARGQFGTTAAAHSAGADVETYYTLSGNVIDLALKLMASGNLAGDAPAQYSLPFAQDIVVDSINVAPDGTRVANSLFFKDRDVEQEFGIQPGDCLFQLAAPFPNNVTSKRVSEIVRSDLGDFVVIEDVTLTDFYATDDDPISADFISQFATLPDGCLLTPDEIDVAEHLRVKRLFLSSINYTFYLKDGIESALEFIEQQLYMPVAAYSIPRKARASLGYTIGPIPGDSIVTFDEKNIKNASKLKVQRSTNKNFYNEIVYKFDEDPVEDQFNSGVVTISENSKNRIQAPNRTLTIEARGLRTADLGLSIAVSQSNRRLNRYQYGAEVFTFDTTLDAGYTVEIGDIIILDGSRLNVVDIKNKTKGMAPRLLEVQNKTFQLKTGAITFDAVDTSYNGAARYGLISPSSRVKQGFSTTDFLIEESFAGTYGQAEYRKWQNLRACSVRVRNSDFSVVGDSTILSATSNRITLAVPLAFTPSAGMVLELTPYSDVDVTAQVKLIYAHMRNSAFADGKPQYQML